MEIKPIRKVGSCYNATVYASYKRIVEVLGFEPNVTDLDDSEKVKASWGFTVDGVRCGIWSYKLKGSPKRCKEWSFYGPKEIAEKLFGEENQMGIWGRFENGSYLRV